MAYLTKTANLGELFNKNNGPWYSNKNKQLTKFQEINHGKESNPRDYRETKNMLRIGKCLISKIKQQKLIQ